MRKKGRRDNGILEKMPRYFEEKGKIIHSLIEKVRIHLINAGVIFDNHFYRL